MKVVMPRRDAAHECENGYGKRTDVSEYRRQSRGGIGLKNVQTSDRNGLVIGIAYVTDRKRFASRHRAGTDYPDESRRPPPDRSRHTGREVDGPCGRRIGLVSIATLSELDDENGSAPETAGDPEPTDSDQKALFLRPFQPREARHQLLSAGGAELDGDLEVVALIFDGDDGPDAKLLVTDAHARAHAAVRGLISPLVVVAASRASAGALRSAARPYGLRSSYAGAASVADGQCRLDHGRMSSAGISSRNRDGSSPGTRRRRAAGGAVKNQPFPRAREARRSRAPLFFDVVLVLGGA
jgi:hypothetical protein